MNAPEPLIEIRPTGPSDVDAVLDILREAQHWLAERGITQWTAPFTAEWALAKIADGELHLVLVAGEPAGCFRMLWSDEFFWREREQGDAVYLHTLAVRRAVAGRGVVAVVLEWMASRARERGRRSLRLDCSASNQGLVGYYTGLGFSPQGEVEVGNEQMLLLERVIP